METIPDPIILTSIPDRIKYQNNKIFNYIYINIFKKKSLFNFAAILFIYVINIILNYNIFILVPVYVSTIR